MGEAGKVGPAEEDAGEKHHRERNDIGERGDLVFGFRESGKGEPDRQEHDAAEDPHHEKVQDVSLEMEIEEKDPRADHNKHLRDEDDQACCDLGDDEIARLHRSGQEPPEDPPFLKQDKPERDTEHAALHNGHGKNPGEEEVDVGQVPAVHRFDDDFRARELDALLERQFIEDALDEQGGDIPLLRFPGIQQGPDRIGRSGMERWGKNHHQHTVPLRKSLKFRFVRSFIHLQSFYGLYRRDEGRIIGTVDNTERDRVEAVEADEAEKKDHEEGEEDRPEDRLFLAKEHFHGGDAHLPGKAHYSSLSEWPVRLRKTSSRLARRSTRSFLNPLETRVLISCWGGALAIMVPRSMMATRSHNSSASSM